MDPELKIEQQASGRWAIVKETAYGERTVLEEHAKLDDAKSSQRLPKVLPRPCVARADLRSCAHG
jgi:hypothetical protein